MRTRCLAAGLVSAALILTSLAVPAMAQSCNKSKKSSAAKLVTVTYPVADLVVPINMDHCSGQPFDEKATTEDKLMELIRSTVAPESWCDVGGQATIQY